MVKKRNSYSKNHNFFENLRQKLVKNRKIPKTSRKINKIFENINFLNGLLTENSITKLIIFQNLCFDIHESHAPISVKKLKL